MKKAFVGITDKDWFHFLKDNGCKEVNFWRPNNKGFRALKENELFLFKLHSPDNYIVGGGFFKHFSKSVPIVTAWQAYGKSNGVNSLEQFKHKIIKYREKKEGDDDRNMLIGCIALTNVFYLEPSEWIPVPTNWKNNIVVGKTYDLEQGYGKELIQQLDYWYRNVDERSIASNLSEERKRYGNIMMIQPRLGQNAFRLKVLDTYQRCCAMSGEKVVPVLEAAHIRPYSQKGEHNVNNGVLLRSDLHKLFDEGYLTITKDKHIEISGKIKEEFKNGREYYALHGNLIKEPGNSHQQLSVENLSWHNDNVYLG